MYRSAALLPVLAAQEMTESQCHPENHDEDPRRDQDDHEQESRTQHDREGTGSARPPHPDPAIDVRLEVVHSGWERLGAEAHTVRNANTAGWESLLPNFVTAAHRTGSGS